MSLALVSGIGRLHLRRKNRSKWPSALRGQFGFSPTTKTCDCARHSTLAIFSVQCSRRCSPQRQPAVSPTPRQSKHLTILTSVLRDEFFTTLQLSCHG